MASIYELTEQANRLRDYLLFEEDDEEARKELDAITGTETNKLRFVSNILAESLALKAGYDEAERMLKNRNDSNDKLIKRLKEYMLFGMSENAIKRIDGDFISLRLQPSPPAVKYSDTFDVNKLPKQCITIVPEQPKPIAKEIKALIEAGEDVPGCWVEQAVGVRVC